MAAYIIAYDLDTPGQKYACLKEKIEAYGYYWHFQKSVWLIQTEETATEIHAKLSPCIDANDKFFVGKLEGESAWTGYDKAGDDWLYGLLG